ncbi:MAG: PAS domain S-box protein, partial [Thermodesulfobacteriota bacterium]|nr:PAS domain S-box protein [Thermodesulfobacteriota bacterium]
MVEDRDRALQSISMELAMGLSEVFEALKRISSGDPEVRISRASKLELIAKLKQMVNLTAENLGEIVDMSHDFAIGLAEHFDVLHRVSEGDLAARVSGTSEVELLESLKEVTNQMIGSVSREITEREQAEKALRQSQERFKIAGKVAYDLIYEWNSEDDSLQWFGNIDAILGYDAEEIPRTVQGWIGLIHPDDISALEGAVEHHRTSTEPISYEYRVRHHNGSWRYWSDRGLPIFDEGGRPRRWIGVCTDITERKKAEGALRKSEERIRAVFEASPDPIVVYDTQGHPEYLNPAFTRVFGWSFDELQGKRIPFVPEDQKEATASKIYEIYESGEPVTFETRRLTKDGRILDVISSAALIWEATGKPSGMVVNLTDVTETKEWQAHLQRAQKTEAIGTLAGGIAHDFNNVLSIIVGNTELAMDDIPEQDPAQNSLVEVRKACLRAREMVKQILSFSRQTEQERVPVNMGLVFRESLQLLRSSIPRTIDIRQNISAEPHTVLAD